MKRLVLFLLTIAGAVVLPVAPASAHQNGCHRWHSCPSDTGSYVCGDLGYSNYCPSRSYTTPTTAYRYYTPPTTAYSYTPPTTRYSYTPPTTAYRYTTPTSTEVLEASTTGDAVLAGLLVIGGVGGVGVGIARSKRSQKKG